ncbi:unnamed protein product [Paramecium sonneborni]|uniref:Uncharacterized protein n=1 Tax=Paramecium sonneborni TaxID=65129 RepID=A0A8S1K135_9CILI|nr:unnamed protein product [Paramecium sonneborni]
MLPIGIRNYIAKQLGIISHKFAQKTKQFCKRIALQQITLFKNTEIVIRKNIDKKNSIINGQFAKITDILFDLDFSSIKSMSQFIINKNEYINKFSKDQMEEIRQLVKILKLITLCDC